MTYPTSPAAAYDYVTFQAGSPTTPLPANQVAADYANHKTSIDQIIAFSKLLQRSDGNLQNGVVHPESLSSGVLALLSTGATFKGAWLTATAYVVNNIVAQNGFNYICIIAHTSGVFATDLAAGKWQLVDGGNARLAADQTFTGANTFSGAAVFSAGVDMTTATPTVATKAAGNSTLAPASTAFVAAALALATGKVNIQVFTTVGANTYTPSAGMVNALGFAWGGGGGGGGTAAAGSTSDTSGGGGGAGSLSIKLMTAAAVGASKVVTIGAAGAAGTSGNNAGGAGGDTSIGSLCIGKGGSGGPGNAGGVSAPVLGGLGGVAGTGDVTTTGMPGSAGIGTAAGTAGLAGSFGASSLVGGGGPSIVVVGAGNAGTGRASGGAGGFDIAAGGARAGGAGTLGYCFIIEFCSQ